MILLLANFRSQPFEVYIVTLLRRKCKKLKNFHNFVKNGTIWKFSTLASPRHCAKCPEANKYSIFDLLLIAAYGQKWPKSAKMGYKKSAHMNNYVNFLCLWYPFDQQRSLSFENFQIKPFLTKLWKFFNFLDFLLSKLTI